MPVATAAVSPTAVSQQIKQLGDDSTAGTMVSPLLDSSGNPAKVTIFGPNSTQGGVATATGVQLSGNQNTAVVRGQGAGIVATFASTLTPASVVTLTALDQTLTTVWGTNPVINALTTDVLVVNKPTSQAGLGFGNPRVTTTGAFTVTFNNITAGTLTPTAAQIYGIVALRNLGAGGTAATTITVTPTAVVTKTTAEQQFAVTGLRVGELVVVNGPAAVSGLDIVGARVVANNTLGITFANFTAGTLTPTAGAAYVVNSLGGIDAPNNTMIAQLAMPANVVTATTAAEVTMTTGNLQATDMIGPVSKPTLQATLLYGSARAASATTIAQQAYNTTATTATPTLAEITTYGITRMNPTAPLVVTAVTLTPAAVATATTAEQTFAVTGVVAGSVVFVNKPSLQPGLGIVGARVSSAGNIAINYLNTTGGTLTPASETYIIGNFQMPIDTTTGNSWAQPAVPVITNQSVLANAMRAQLVALSATAPS